jgi:formylglycine-generating enzyme required for sulfatase activity
MNTEHHIDELFARLNDAAQDEVLRVAELDIKRPPIARERKDYRHMLSEWMAEYRHALLPVILRLRDLPDGDIEQLVADGDLQIGEPTQVKGISVRMSLDMALAVEGGESSQQGVLLSDLAAASEVLTETFLALSAASRPLGEILEPPEAIVSKGSVGFSLPGGLLGAGIGLIVVAASGMIAPPLPAYVGGAALTSVGMIDKWLEWYDKWLDIKKKRSDIENAKAKQEELDCDNTTESQGGFAHAFLVPRHIVQAEAERFGLTEGCANHLLNRCMPVAQGLRERIPDISIERLPENPLLLSPTVGPSRRPLPGFTDTLKDGTYGPEMIKIPGGSFLMGSLKSEQLRPESEGPQHEVTVRPFAIGKFAVTFEEYDKLAQATRSRQPKDFQSEERGRRPVIGVSWEDAVKYAEWLSHETGKHYRLPSEAEWEYAARAGTQTRWSFGDEVSDLDKYAWWSVNSEGRAHPVGEKDANRWGLYDVHGNVWEWVQDCWHDNYHGAPTDGSAWEAQGGGDCGRRVLRGGSWFYEPGNLRSAYRSGYFADFRGNDIGFRLAQDL